MLPPTIATRHFFRHEQGLLRDGERTRKRKKWSLSALRWAYIGELRLMAQGPEGRRLLKEWAGNGAGTTDPAG